MVSDSDQITEQQPEDSAPKRSAVTFRLADNGQLLAELIPDALAPVFTLHTLKSQLQSDELSYLWIDDDALQAVVVKASMAEKGQVIVGERRDAKAEVHIANNKMVAHIDLQSAYGGRPLSREALNQLLLKYQISNNCTHDDLIEAALEQGEGSSLVVAKAIEAVAGEDGRLEVLIKESIMKSFDEADDGSVDFHELQDFVVVDEGDELARIVPATPGDPGEDVLGVAIAPQPGKPIKFAGKLEGAAISESDPNLLLATVKGHPVIMNDGVSVDPTLLLKNVNLASGNIDFDGSVLIKGSVASGYEVRATGDVIVKDSVDKAKIFAGGNIQIGNGVMGEEPSTGVPSIDDEDPEQMKTYLCAEGDVSLKFMNMVEIKAGQNINIKEYVMHSRMTAADSVLLGQSGGKGTIFGGVTKAGNHIIANQIGNDAYLKTAVEVGEANEAATRLKALRVETQKRQANHQKLSVAIEKIRRVEKVKPLNDELKAKAEKIESTLDKLDEQLKKLESAKDGLKKRIKGREPSSVQAKGFIFPNVSLMIDGLGYQQTVESKAVCMKNKDDEVEMSAFSPMKKKR